MSEITRQCEGRHCVITISIRSKTTEAHSLLSQERGHFEQALGSVLSPKSDPGVLLRALESVTGVDNLVDEHMKRKG